MTSSFLSPSQNIGVPLEKQNTEVKQDVMKENRESTTKPFEDNAGDLPEGATKGDSNTNMSEDERNDDENVNESQSQEKEEEKTNAGLDEESKSNDSKKEDEGDGNDSSEKEESEKGSVDSKSESEEENKSEENSSEPNDEKKEEGGIEEKVGGNQDKESDESGDGQAKEKSSKEVYPSGAQSELLNETTTQNGAFSTQAAESKNEKEAQQSLKSKQQEVFTWKLCNTTAGPDYIPCLDNWNAIRHLKSTKHYEHRERHCPVEPPTCLVPLPEGYRRPIGWPKSREKVCQAFFVINYVV